VVDQFSFSRRATGLRQPFSITKHIGKAALTHIRSTNEGKLGLILLWTLLYLR